MLRAVTKKEAQLPDGQWDSYVAASFNGTIFHEAKFTGYHPEDRFDDVPLLFMKGDKIVALINFAVIQKGLAGDNIKSRQRDRSILSSYPGASWGGVVSKGPLSYQQATEIVKLIIGYALNRDLQGIEITMPSSIYYGTADDVLTFCLLEKGFRYKKRELTSVVNLNRDEVKFDRSVTKAVNKSLRSGIKTDKNEPQWESFYKLLTDNLSEKGNTPTHTLDELLLLKKLYPDRIEHWNAFKSDTYVGGLCNWEVKKGIWLIFYSCYDKEYTSDRVLNRLFHDSIRYYQSNNESYVDFGTSSIDMKVNKGLIRFKELYSANSVFRDTLYLDL